MTPIRELFDFLIEAAQSPRKFLAFLGLLASFGLLGRGIVVAQIPEYPHWLTTVWLGAGFILGSLSGVALYWLRSAESSNTDAEALAIVTLARHAELDRQTHRASHASENRDQQPPRSAQ